MSEDMMDYQSLVERAMKGVVREALLKVGKDGLPGDHHLYITFRTQDEGVEITDRLIEELKAADVIVLGVPMYNFGVPSSLKAWFDHIARAGVTFRYTAKGPVGLLTKKQAYVMAARGGVYAGTAADSQTPWLRTMLGFLGIREVEIVYAEGVAKGDAERRAALEEARTAIESLDLERAA